METPSFWSKLSTLRESRWVDAFSPVSDYVVLKVMGDIPKEQFHHRGRYPPQQQLG
jgi:hypothetical protein